ncbi:hypothetical protein E9934_00320 [Nocardioides caeni]|uniref:Uncharacterized protein n=1 Tax=Nocardioides caeni TaxID=574700 RepID=A0A4S8NMF0_9ACTN|nr:hypothetical protein E9934_00320 [Nocardioides caeni]
MLDAPDGGGVAADGEGGGAVLVDACGADAVLERSSTFLGCRSGGGCGGDLALDECFEPGPPEPPVRGLVDFVVDPGGFVVAQVSGRGRDMPGVPDPHRPRGDPGLEAGEAVVDVHRVRDQPLRTKRRRLDAGAEGCGGVLGDQRCPGRAGGAGAVGGAFRERVQRVGVVQDSPLIRRCQQLALGLEAGLVARGREGQDVGLAHLP